MAKDAWALVKEKEDIFNSLYARMDEDRDLLYLSKYKMQDKHGKDIPGIVNITLNDCALFAANVISGLGATKQQVVVETEDKKLNTAYIEDFQKAMLNAANLRLRKAGRPLLSPFHDEQLSIRGRGADRCLVRMEDGELVPDIIPLDTRYFTYEMGKDGMLWGGYKTRRAKALIETEYGISVKGKEAVVLDWWDTEKNEVWIDGNKKFEQANAYGYPPFVFQVVSLGSMLQDEDALKHWGESIFFLIRDIIPELNRFASIVQTQHMATLKGAKILASQAGYGADTQSMKEMGYDEMGALTAVEVGDTITLVPTSDIKRGAMVLHSMLESRMQRGSLTAIDLGNLTFPLSAVALVEIGEGRDQVFLPRLDAKAQLNQSLAEMFTAQVVQIGGHIEIGVAGQKRTFDTRKLQGEYTTTYRYFPKTPTVDIARFAVADAARDWWLDWETTVTEILQQQDPAEIRRRRYYDMAEVLSPLVRMRRTVKALIEQEEEEEAQLLTTQAGLTLEQLLAGEAPAKPPTEPTRVPAQPVLPLLGEGGQVGGIGPRRRAQQLIETPEQEAGGE